MVREGGGNLGFILFWNYTSIIFYKNMNTFLKRENQMSHILQKETKLIYLISKK